MLQFDQRLQPFLQLADSVIHLLLDLLGRGERDNDRPRHRDAWSGDIISILGDEAIGHALLIGERGKEHLGRGFKRLFSRNVRPFLDELGVVLVIAALVKRDGAEPEIIARGKLHGELRALRGDEFAAFDGFGNGDLRRIIRANGNLHDGLIGDAQGVAEFELERAIREDLRAEAPASRVRSSGDGEALRFCRPPP